jgi:ferric-dicitrate binding protein FerR (iron transport regulator)
MQEMGGLNKEKEITELYRQFLANELSREQLDTFLLLLSAEEQEETFLALMTATWQETQPVPVNIPVAKSRVRVLHRAGWWAMAAAVVLLVVAGMWILGSQRDKGITGPVARAKGSPARDKAPGGNKAVLTLSDGSSIVLDTAANGTLVQQGGVKVTKQANGVLLYEISKQEAATGVAVGYNTLTTPRGGQFRIALPDGSQVWLNAVSSLKYPTLFTGDTREVELTGEGYFEIAENAQMPFIVKNSRMDIQVLGTAFNMMCYADEDIARTTLVNGKVKVGKGQEELVLQPEQQVRVPENGTKWKLVQQADIAEALAWRNGLFQLKSADVGAIMRQVARWYNVEVVYTGEVPQKKLVGFLSREEGLEKVVAVLSANGIRCKLEGDQLIVQ